MHRLAILLSVVTGCVATAATAASAGKPPDIPQSYLFTAGGRLTPLRAGVTYRASQFPLALRIRAGRRGWSGAQWKSGKDYFAGGDPPNYGWVHIGHGSSSAPPRGLITIMTAYTRTPSVARTINVLRTRGRGAAYGDTSPVTVSGFSGTQFDGDVTGAKNVHGIGHYFIPFAPRSSGAKYYPDEYPVYGDTFRVIVLNVRGKTVVMYIENVALPAGEFPTFLSEADKILASLRFPE